MTRALEVHSLPAPSHPALASILRQTPSGVTLAVRAQPRAKKTAIAGVYGQAPAAQLKIAVHAPPREGRANSALVAFLAQTLALPKNAITLLSGESARSKVFLLNGVALERAEARLSEWLSKT